MGVFEGAVESFAGEDVGESWSWAMGTRRGEVDVEVDWLGEAVVFGRGSEDLKALGFGLRVNLGKGRGRGRDGGIFEMLLSIVVRPSCLCLNWSLLKPWRDREGGGNGRSATAWSELMERWNGCIETASVRGTQKHTH